MKKFAAMPPVRGGSGGRAGGQERRHRAPACLGSERIPRMADPEPSPTELEERITGLADALDRLIAVVSKLDDETSDTAAAAFDSDVPRVAGHKATADELKSLSDTLDSWRRDWTAGNDG